MRTDSRHVDVVLDVCREVSIKMSSVYLLTVYHTRTYALPIGEVMDQAARHCKHVWHR